MGVGKGGGDGVPRRTRKHVEGMRGERDEDTAIVNLIEVGGNHQVMLQVTIAEMSRSLTREFGMNFAALINTGGGGSLEWGIWWEAWGARWGFLCGA